VLNGKCWWEGRVMATFYLIVSTYAALYLTIWMHEVGHALAYWRFGCKENFWKVQVPLYLLGSSPAPVDETHATHLNSSQQLIVAASGVVVNCIFGFPTLLIVLSNGSLATISLVYVFIYLFSLCHLLEAGSYLVINSLFLGGDMTLIAKHAPRARWLVFVVASLILLPAIALLVREAPHIGYVLFNADAVGSTWQLGVGVFSGFIIVAMGVARVFSSRIREQAGYR